MAACHTELNETTPRGRQSPWAVATRGIVLEAKKTLGPARILMNANEGKPPWGLGVKNSRSAPFANAHDELWLR